MPRFIAYQQQKLPKGYRATGEAFGAGVGRAIAQVESSISGMGEMMERAKQAERSAKKTAVYAETSAKFNNGVERIGMSQEWETHPLQFDSLVQDMKDEAKSAFGDDEGLYTLWEQNFNIDIIKNEIKMQKSALTMQKVENDARIDHTLTLLATQAAQATDPLSKKQFIKSANDLLADSLDDNLIDSVEHLNWTETFQKEYMGAEARELIRKDPSVAYDKLTNPEDEDFMGMPQETREIWVDRAVSARESELRESEIQQKEAERAKKLEQLRIETETAKDANELVREGKLTANWVMNRRDELSETDYRYFLDLTHERQQQLRENREYSDLSAIIREGKGDSLDIKPRIEKAFINGTLDRSGYDALMSMLGRRMGDPVSWIDSNRNALIGSFGTEEQLGSIPNLVLRKNNAIVEFDRFLLDNPSATMDQVSQKREELLKQYLYTPVTFDLYALPRLTYGPSIPSTDMNIQEIGRKTKEAFTNGKIDQTELNAQVELIKQYSIILQKINEGGNQ